MPLTPEQKARQEEAYAELKNQLPVDFVPGISVSPAPSVDLEEKSPWLSRMRSMSKDLGQNAYTYFNLEVRKGRTVKVKKKPRRVLSVEGFPQDISVTYAYPPPFAYASVAKTRDVRYLVFHSFGHMWHATGVGKDAVGWLNATSGGRGVQTFNFNGKTVYIAKGSDTDTLHHYSRFVAGLKTVLLPTATATAHFFIDRNGNLVVIGDCNDILYTSNALSSTSVGVELEEAFYVLEDPKKTPAIWKSGGNPPGTAGNVQYFTYSAKQLFTLSILCKKLELAYPKIGQRNVDLTPRSFTSQGAPGYTMHDFIKGSTHFDVSPHFREQKLWDAFFSLVDTQTHITPDMLWKPAPKYEDSVNEELQEREKNAADNGGLNPLSDILLDPAKVASLGQKRALSSANSGRRELNGSAGTRAVQDAYRVQTTYAGITRKIQQSEAHSNVKLSGNLNVVTSTGQQINSDDVW